MAGVGTHKRRQPNCFTSVSSRATSVSTTPTCLRQIFESDDTTWDVNWGHSFRNIKIDNVGVSQSALHNGDIYVLTSDQLSGQNTDGKPGRTLLTAASSMDSKHFFAMSKTWGRKRVWIWAKSWYNGGVM